MKIRTIERAILITLAAWGAMFMLSACPAAKTAIQAAPTGVVCDLVAVTSGDTFMGVVCSDVADFVKTLVAQLPRTAAASEGPCKLAAVTRGGLYAGSVCEEIAPAVQAHLDQDGGAP